MKDQYMKELRGIIESACRTLGLENNTFKQSDALDNLTVTEWVSLCENLYLPLDSISYGYFRQAHKARIRVAWENGDLWLPRTRALKVLLREIAEDHRREVKCRSKHYGIRLRWKMQMQDFRQEALQLPYRIRNEILVRVQYRRSPKIIRISERSGELTWQGGAA